MDEPAADTWFRIDGRPYAGAVCETSDGVRFGEETTTCAKCSGKGAILRRGRRPRDCLSCKGEGFEFDQFRIYDAAAMAVMEDRRVRRETARAERERRLEADRARMAGVWKADNAAVTARAQLRKENRFVADMLAALERWGSLTDAQASRLVEILDRMDADEAAFAASRPVGAEGERIEIVVTCRSAHSFFREKYKGKGSDEVFVTEMLGEDGNAYRSITAAFTLDPGETARIRGTVKTHENRDGWPSTRLERVRNLTLDAEPEPAPAARM